MGYFTTDANANKHKNEENLPSLHIIIASCLTMFTAFVSLFSAQVDIQSAADS